MNFLKYLMLFLFTYPMYSFANTNVEQAMQAYKEKQYDQAAHILATHFNQINTSNAINKLKAALIFSKNLKLYQDIYQKSKTNQKKYLTALAHDSTENHSLFAKLYLAEILVSNKKFKEAETLLKEFIKAISPNNQYAHIANTNLAWISYAKNDIEKYHQYLDRVDKSRPLVALSIQHMQVQLTGKTRDSLKKTKEYEQAYLAENNALSSRFANYIIQAYLSYNDLQSAANIFSHLDQRQPSYVENLGKQKTLKFYDASLVDSIAKLYFELSKTLLKSVAKDPKYHDLAIFHLSELGLIRQGTKATEKYLAQVEKLKRLPKNMRSLTRIRSTTHQYLNGQHHRAYQAWQEMMNGFKTKPVQSADIVLMCIYLDANCPKIIKTAQVFAEDGQSNRFEALSTNVGRYYLQKRNHVKALRLFANALDRSKTKNLFTNDPMLLLNYAEALRLNKKFSESLQILFSLGKHFPILRQVQNAVQGEYLYSQRSNGFNYLY
ncbi:MAG TPA: hypothetical protein ENK06_14530 [Gammaproteobacteria bacterium]|nr:hypothetical protein [Gammaproteobacteria bacterium]